MKTTATVLTALSLALLAGLAGCGKKGALLLPLSNVPSSPSGLGLVQRGATIILEWTNPTTYIDGHPLEKPAAVEVWLVEERVEAGKPAPRLPNAEEFASKSRLVVRIPREQFSPAGKEKAAAAPMIRYEYPLTAGSPVGLSLIFGLRAADAGRKLSAYSDLAAVLTLALPSPPVGLKATVRNEAIELGWEAPPDNIDRSVPARLTGYHLYRSIDGNPAVRLNPSLITDTRFGDTTFEFGLETVYTVRAATQDAEPYGQSSDSAPCRLRPEDTFAPAAPEGLMSMTGLDFISLSWDACGEKDLAGYRVWRRAEGQSDYVELTAAAIKETNFQDSTAERGRRYEYAVTAEDIRGNRSGRSAPVSEQIKGGRP